MAPILKADKTKPGEYKPITPETNPERFSAAGDAAQLASKDKKARKALDKMLLGVLYPRSATSTSATVQASEAELTDSGDEDGSGAFIANPAPTNQQDNAKARAVALEPNDEPWKKNDPKAQPLTYAVPTDVNGGVMYRTLKFTVNFSDGNSIEKANKCRRQGLYRAGKKLDLPLKRPPTGDRKYTDTNNRWIYNRYDSYGAANNGRRIGMTTLTVEYNARFPTENRSYQGIASQISRIGWLHDKKESYPTNS